MNDPKPYTLRQRVGLILGPALFLLLLSLPFGDKPTVARMAAIAALMAVWWITEAIPIPATALLPIALYPLFGIGGGAMKAGAMKAGAMKAGAMKASASMMGGGITAAYAHYFVFLFMGGFIIALALQRWGLHRRVALAIISLIGQDPRRLVLGFMLATASLSMWICNAATTMTMVPMALSVIALLREQRADERLLKRFPVALLLGIGYAASIGGFGTLVGMMTNLSFARSYSNLFPHLPPVGFVEWMWVGLPFALIFLLLTWALLVYVILPLNGEAFGGEALIAEARATQGPMTPQERRVAILFGLVILAWISRVDIQIGGMLTIPGWTRLLMEGLQALGVAAPELPKLVNNGTIAIGGALLLFLIPSGRGQGERLMDWAHAKALPWGLLILFGGGFALAQGFTQSGLSAWIGQQLGFLQGAPTPLLVGGVTLGVSALTELTSNVATVEMALPILASLAQELGLHPLQLMLPAALAASCAFMLPVATPPNAIIFGSGEVPITQMARAGLIINVVGLLLILLVSFTLAPWVMGF
ncbi:anion permease [Myxococcota bacterium]|nr:anion permease [Myxococcota bacterium]MBU1430759.1 anion permease [Myxococcota bacterium]MBU1896498.1 anion permease [Myxococcota bacterium]